jgi:hypothetical protein
MTKLIDFNDFSCLTFHKTILSYAELYDAAQPPSPAKFCDECGAPYLRETSKFCSECGSKRLGI